MPARRGRGWAGELSSFFEHPTGIPAGASYGPFRPYRWQQPSFSAACESKTGLLTFMTRRTLLRVGSIESSLGWTTADQIDDGGKEHCRSGENQSIPPPG